MYYGKTHSCESFKVPSKLITCALCFQARLKSDILLNETDYANFNLRFGASMNSIQDILSKFILIRLSLPDQDESVG